MELPVYVQIEPVGQCNLRCQMCPIQFRRDGPPYGPPAFMPFETYTHLIDQFEGLPELHLQGLGEPMMHPRFFDMIEYAATKGIRVTTNSNLTLLNERRAERCVTSGLDCLHISIDGATAATYERIRVRGHFDRILRNLARLEEARNRLGLPGPRLHLVTVIMRQNLAELPDLVRLAAEWQMEEMFVQQLCHDFEESSLPAHYRPMRNFIQNEALVNEDQKKVEYYFAEARQVARELGLRLRLPKTEMRLYSPGTPGRERCDWPWRGAYISYDGYAMPCCMIATPDRANLGNMAEDGVEQVWNGADYQAFRAKLDSDDPPEICRSCSVYSGTF
ncbi:MAG TPA: radical SAM protein [Chloroflexia bacterium]|nr:radical SAM protein [Chloroflexia bacterium]